MSGYTPETQKKMDKLVREALAQLPTMTPEEYLLYNLKTKTEKGDSK